MEGPTQYIEEHLEKILSDLRKEDLKPDVFYNSSQLMEQLTDASIHLVVTSPPYPMIEMWDALFERELGIVSGTFASQRDPFALAHDYLSKTWAECFRVLDKGGILCINIGDATRTIDGNFRCYSNHTRIAEICERLGFQSLVPILWKKPTNKPNAFLGSGFFPPNAYVTLDCEYILIFRKGRKRALIPQDPLRYASQFSKRERDAWFSQIWEIRGAVQNHQETARFPDEIPYRLIRMFSCLGEKVLDPFVGTGTTVRMARALGRKGIGYEVNQSLRAIIDRSLAFTAPDPSDVLSRILSIYNRTDGSDSDASATVSSRERPLQTFV